LVDTEGNPLVVIVHPAYIPYREGADWVLEAAREKSRRLQHIRPDSQYTGELVEWWGEQGITIMHFTALILCGCGAVLSRRKESAVSETQQWTVKGEYFENCSCDVVCPCEISPGGFLTAMPDNGYCNVVLIFHVNEGTYGGVNLSGLNAVLAARADGVMGEGNWKAALYIDERASSEQQEALGTIFGGHAGGPPSVVAALIGQVVGAKTVPIEYRNEGKKRSARIDGVLNANIQAVPAAVPDAVVIKLNANPLFPGQDWVQAYGTQTTYSDYDFQWDNTGKCADYAEFSWTGP
jgi:hypothetical protein